MFSMRVLISTISGPYNTGLAPSERHPSRGPSPHVDLHQLRKGCRLSTGASETHEAHRGHGRLLRIRRAQPLGRRRADGRLLPGPVGPRCSARRRWTATHGGLPEARRMRGRRRYRGGRPRSLSLSTGRGLRSPAPMSADSLDLRLKVLDAVDRVILREKVARDFGVFMPTLERSLGRNEGHAPAQTWRHAPRSPSSSGSSSWYQNSCQTPPSSKTSSAG